MLYEIIGTDDRQAVPDTRIAPYRYICQLRTVLRNGYSIVGTGFFIGPHTLLTTVHNVWDPFVGPAGARVAEAQVAIIPARNSANDSPFGIHRPAAILLPYAGFTNAGIGRYQDYALIRLEEPVGWKTGYFGITAAPLPDKTDELRVDVAGYPGDKDLPFTGRQYTSSEQGIQIDGSGRFLLIRNDTSKGMSGSPVWITKAPGAGGRIAAGLLLGAGEKDPTGRYLYNVARYLDDDVRAFIKKYSS